MFGRKSGLNELPVQIFILFLTVQDWNNDCIRSHFVFIAWSHLNAVVPIKSFLSNFNLLMLSFVAFFLISITTANRRQTTQSMQLHAEQNNHLKICWFEMLMLLCSSIVYVGRGDNLCDPEVVMSPQLSKCNKSKKKKKCLYCSLLFKLCMLIMKCTLSLWLVR